MLDKKELRSKTVKRQYGMHMTEPRKRQGEIYIRDWLNTVRRTDENGGSEWFSHSHRKTFVFHFFCIGPSTAASSLPSSEVALES